jgi:hypothetical protein
MCLTGKSGNLPQALAVRFMRECLTYIPVGDSLAMRCESAVPDRQFRVWSRWFQRHEDRRWQIIEDQKAFFFYKSC